MQYTNLGKSDLKVSRICMGCMGFGNAAAGQHNWTVDETQTREIIKRGLDLGINFYDTAIAYQNGTSEQYVGKALRDFAGRDDYVIATKFTPRTQDEIDTGVSGQKHIKNYLEQSLSNLGMDYVDFYWIHNPVGAPKWVTELIPLAKSGKIGKIGLSNHNLSEIKEAEGILAKEGLKISAIQNHFSILNRSSEESGILDYCKENDITFFAYMVLEQGALSGKYDTAHPLPADSERGRTYNPLLPQIEKIVAVMRDIADSHGIKVAQIPMAWAIAKGTLPIIGVTKATQVEDAAKAAAVELTVDEIKALESVADEMKLNVIRGWEKEMK